jgi:hypothetical protein
MRVQNFLTHFILEGLTPLRVRIRESTTMTAVCVCVCVCVCASFTG